MDSTFRRTSVTVDEAVAILLGWIDGPVELTSVRETPTDEEQELGESLQFNLQDFMDDEEARLENAYEDAKNDKLPESVITEKCEALMKFRDEVQQAKTYLCDIRAELNKGDSLSALKRDNELAESLGDHITLSSFDHWTQNEYKRRILAPVPVASDILLSKGEASTNSDGDTDKKQGQVKRQKMRQQEDAILATITKLGYDPKCLPKNEEGKPGVRAAVRKALKNDPLFEGRTVFKHAWERMEEMHGVRCLP